MATAADNTVSMDNFYETHSNRSEVFCPEIKSSENACLVKLIHPPSSVPTFEGLPTLDARSQVVTKYVNVGINAQSVVEIEGKTQYVNAPYQSNFAILCPSGARVDAICFALNPQSSYPSGYMTQDLANVIYNQAYNFSNWYEDANLYRPIGKSLTTYLNATMFNNTGIVSGEQFNPNILFAGTLLDMSLLQPTYFYQYVRSMDKRASLKFPPGYVVLDNRFDRFPVYIQDEVRRILKAPGPINLDPNTTIQVINMGEIGGDPATPNFIPSPNQIMNQSARAYTGQAKDGTFSVQRLNTVSPAWLSSANTSKDEKPPALPGLYDCYYYVVDSNGGGHFVPFAENTPVGVAAPDVKTLRDTLWSKDLTWSITYYSGIGNISTESLSPIGGNLVAYKIYTIFEIQPAPRSAWAGLMKLAPAPSLKTMEELLAGFYDLKDCMPASCNAGFMDVASKLAGDGLKVILDKVIPSGDSKEKEKEGAPEKEMSKLAIQDSKKERVTTKNNPKYTQPPARYSQPRKRPPMRRPRPPSMQRHRSSSRRRSSSRGRLPPPNRRRSTSKGRRPNNRR